MAGDLGAQNDSDIAKGSKRKRISRKKSSIVTQPKAV